MSSPEDRPLLIALHGHGGEPSSAEQWARRVVPANWTVLAIAAPEESPGVRSWFSTDSRGADPTMIAEQLAVIAEAAETHRGDGPVVLAGFSQGAAMVFEAVLAGLDLSAAVAVAGFLPEYEHSPTERAAAPEHSTPLLVVAGRDDEAVPSFFSEDAALVLVAAGIPTEVRVLDGGHEVSDEAVAVMSDWLAVQLAMPAQSESS